MSQSNILKALSKESNLYTAIETIGTLQRFKKNEIIYLQDDEACNFFLLKSGRVRLFFTAMTGNELTMKILGADDIFGDASYFSHTARITSASALSDVELYSVELDDLVPHLTQHPELIAELLDTMAQTIRLFSIQVYSMGFLSADKKVAHLLVQLGSYFKQYGSDQEYCIDYSHQELADLIGIARVTTTKELKKFENKGWVSLAYRNIQVLDETALKDYLLS
ncbi:Crp/Fnr family transcriptional regulator [Bacillus benzoevorans]|uniref:CRP/FNR family transcriptional regulator n=1 Tax=Bacillus benzoevorans TaxID=1456 RepID=A0A7X0HTN3_9BACI|nr:Crp/Fnr family transcriptional regulator [Bacillus benzoevorans]MBB6446633.1 CRP/FNR family transcriptional regulator [Bacillus benzoevorans]